MEIILFMTSLTSLALICFCSKKVASVFISVFRAHFFIPIYKLVRFLRFDCQYNLLHVLLFYLLKFLSLCFIILYFSSNTYINALAFHVCVCVLRLCFFLFSLHFKRGYAFIQSFRLNHVTFFGVPLFFHYQ